MILKDLATESLHDSLGLKISPHTQQEAPHPQPANMSFEEKERSKLQALGTEKEAEMKSIQFIYSSQAAESFEKLPALQVD